LPRFDLPREDRKIVEARANLAQGLGLVQETVVIADEVEHHQLFLALGFAQATAELLQEKDLRFRRPEHQHRVDRRQVNTFAEQVHREDHLQPPVRQLRKRVTPAHLRSGIDGRSSDAGLSKLHGHVLGVANRNAERQGALLRFVAPLPERMAGRAPASPACWQAVPGRTGRSATRSLCS
jgi:hypothetical protein